MNFLFGFCTNFVAPDESKDREILLSKSSLSLNAVDRSTYSEFQIFSLIFEEMKKCSGRDTDWKILLAFARPSVEDADSDGMVIGADSVDVELTVWEGGITVEAKDWAPARVLREVLFGEI